MLKCQLAKVYESEKLPKSNGYYITEKLDGNRCIAEYNGEKWCFYSRSGKALNVNFDMAGFDKAKTYDGEIIKTEQWKDRKASDFNALNGLIQAQGTKKSLVYIVFDYQDENAVYSERRKHLDGLTNTETTFILPLLAKYDTQEELTANVGDMLDEIVNAGGEGLMINTDDTYKATRTNALLKVKQSKTIDMEVIGITKGNGKCSGMIGALQCKTITDDGKTIITEVGSGFTDKERTEFLSGNIIGKIVEIEYFSLSQNEETKGTNTYSLRFPRFTRVRNDKATPTEYVSNAEIERETVQETTTTKETDDLSSLYTPPKKSVLKTIWQGIKFIGGSILYIIGVLFSFNFILDMFEGGKK